MTKPSLLPDADLATEAKALLFRHSVLAFSKRSREYRRLVALKEEAQRRECKHDWEWRISGSVCKFCGTEQRDAFKRAATLKAER